MSEFDEFDPAKHWSERSPLCVSSTDSDGLMWSAATGNYGDFINMQLALVVINGREGDTVRVWERGEVILTIALGPNGSYAYA